MVAKPKAALAAAKVLAVRWQHGVLTITVRRVPKGERLRVTLQFIHHPPRTLLSRRRTFRVRTGRPKDVLIALMKGSQTSAIITSKPRR